MSPNSFRDLASIVDPQFCRTASAKEEPAVPQLAAVGFLVHKSECVVLVNEQFRISPCVYENTWKFKNIYYKGIPRWFLELKVLSLKDGRENKTNFDGSILMKKNDIYK